MATEETASRTTDATVPTGSLEAEGVTKDRHVGKMAIYINGEWGPAVSGETFETVDPSTGEVLGTVPRGTDEDIDRAVRAAKDALPGWRDTPAFARGLMLRQLSTLLTEQKEEFARIEALDSGHYYAKALQLMEATPLWFDYHAGLADKVGGRTINVPGGQLDFTLLEPLGVTGHIIPWNYPFLLVARSVAPALAMGNTVVIKPAEETPLSALKFAELCEQAGMPPGVVNVVTGFGAEAGTALASHELVDGITFTGSVSTGKLVAKMAADHVAQANLELGGKSPNIIFPDARFDDALEGVMQGILSHAGQVCIAGSRLFLHRDIHDRFLEALVEKMRDVKLGDIFDEGTQMGPLVSQEQLERVLNYVDVGKQEGAKLLFGGGRPEDESLQNGYYVEPTIFSDVDNSMRIAQEEIFGPVLSVIAWDDEEEMIREANDSPFGLYAAIWTQDINKALTTARRLEAGGVVINDFFGEVPQAPHGGQKQSGVNREEGLETIANYTQVKNVVVNLGDRLTGAPGLPADWADAPL
ncbi:MAG: Aldehyde dehydrogenase [uncultured Rubrobacteraceae bacterium]|uniref:Aldehyde dehydrogenase n=1 Tax=uncultured Rubrobacteraceae bacterium TaxID=349277 RepID=A0A6J4PWQ7_9ACTN|nr:MAG: Aldehyde dehydrogenase [uncultured Rubrobacteraceae bacterium]